MIARNCTLLRVNAMTLHDPRHHTRPWLVLICGPYLSRTGGDEDKIAANRARLEAMALPVYERGHLPLQPGPAAPEPPR